MLKIVIPLIVIFIIAGSICFSLAFTYYPKKNVNVNINGNCYEILGPAFIEYKNLEAEKELRVLIHEYNSLGEQNLPIPIIYTGIKEQVQDFITKYNVKVTDKQEVGAEMYSTRDYIGKTILKGEISKSSLLKVITDIITFKGSLNKNILYNLGIQSISSLTSIEREKISNDANSFMLKGIQKILQNEKGTVKPAECRSQIEYNTNLRYI